MPRHLAVDAFCPAARKLAKETLGWWIICENNWARILKRMETMEKIGARTETKVRSETEARMKAEPKTKTKTETELKAQKEG